MNQRIYRVLLVIILIGISVLSTFGLSGCAASCEVEKYIESVAPYLAEWSTVSQRAKSAPRLVLTEEIENMQGIRDEVAGMKVQSCLTEEHKLLVQAMDDEINGLISFIRQEPDETVTAYFESSDENLQKWKDALLNK